MKRKICSIVLTLIFVLSFGTVSSVVADDVINVTIDGEAVAFPGGQGPVIVDDRTLVPVRGVFEHLGFEVDWIHETSTAVLENDEFEVRVSVGSNVFAVNGVNHNLDVPAQLINDRTMLPIRLVLESVGYNVYWDGATNTVLIFTPDSDESRPIYRPLNLNLPPRAAATGAVNSNFSADALHLVEMLEVTHPLLHERFRHMLLDYERTRNEFIDHASRAANLTDFKFEVSRFLRVLRDSNSSSVMNLLQENMYVQDNWIVRENRLFTTGISGNTDAEIVEIGGVCVQLIFDTIDKYFGHENYYCRRYTYTIMSRSRDIHERAGVTHNNSSVRIVIEENGVRRDMAVNYSSGQPFIGEQDNFDYNIRHEMMGDVFYIRLREFRTVQPEQNQVLAAIREAVALGTRYFIIDLRYNPGGVGVSERIYEVMGFVQPNRGWYSRLSPVNTTGLRHTTAGREPGFLHENIVPSGTYFHRSENPNNLVLAVLTNNISYNTSVDMASRAQDGGFGVIIGEPPRNAANFFDRAGPIQLPNTGIVIEISTSKTTRVDVNADPFVLHPDIYVSSDQALEAALYFFANRETHEAEVARLARVEAVRAARDSFVPPPNPWLVAQTTPHIEHTHAIIPEIRNILGVDFDIRGDATRSGGNTFVYLLPHEPPVFTHAYNIVFMNSLHTLYGDVLASFHSNEMNRIDIFVDIGSGADNGDYRMRRTYKVISLDAVQISRYIEQAEALTPIIRNIVGVDFDIGNNVRALGNENVFVPIVLRGQPTFSGTHTIFGMSHLDSQLGDVFVNFLGDRVRLFVDIGAGEEHDRPQARRAYKLFQLSSN